jgi:hypothetical protein
MLAPEGLRCLGVYLAFKQLQVGALNSNESAPLVHHNPATLAVRVLALLSRGNGSLNRRRLPLK